MGYKILLADDSVTVQKIITLTFSDEGVDVLTVNNGDEAVNRLQYMRPALVMADVSIPGKNGYEICEFVKQHPELKDTPVILLVPAFEPFDEERARRIGADHYLTKPFQSIRTLISTVKSLIEPGENHKVKPVIAEAGTKGEEQSFQSAELIGAGAAVAESSAIPYSAEDSLLNLDSAGAEGEATEAENGWPEHSQNANVLPFGRGSADDSDRVLDLDDVLWMTPVAQPASAAKPARSFAPVVDINETARGPEPAAGAPLSSAILSEGAIDEIVERVVAQLTERLTETLAQRLTHDLARQLAPEVAEIVKQQQLAEKVSYRDPDALLELDEV